MAISTVPLDCDDSTFKPGTITVYKNGMRNTSKHTIPNAAWEEADDAMGIIWCATPMFPTDVLIIEREQS